MNRINSAMMKHKSKYLFTIINRLGWSKPYELINLINSMSLDEFATKTMDSAECNISFLYEPISDEELLHRLTVNWTKGESDD